MNPSMLMNENDMPALPSYQDALFWRLGTFRPSDRLEFEKAFKTDAGSDAAVEAVVRFVGDWENADWLEDYSIERIGKWMAKTAPQKTHARLLDWATRSETPARKALLKGLRSSTLAG